MELTACKELETKVIREKLCTLCGACTGMCPYLMAYRGRIVLRDECNLTQGRCLHHLKEASLTKKKRGLKNIIQKTGKAEDLLYLKSDAKIVKDFLNE